MQDDKSPGSRPGRDLAADLATIQGRFDLKFTSLEDAEYVAEQMRMVRYWLPEVQKLQARLSKAGKIIAEMRFTASVNADLYEQACDQRDAEIVSLERQLAARAQETLIDTKKVCACKPYGMMLLEAGL